MKKTPRRQSPSRTPKAETPEKAKCITVRLMPPLLRQIDAKAASEYMTREAFIRRAAANASEGTDTRPTVARGLFSPVKPIGRTPPKTPRAKSGYTGKLRRPAKRKTSK